MQVGKMYTIKSIKYLVAIFAIAVAIFFIGNGGINFVSNFFAGQTGEENILIEETGNQSGITDAVKKIISTPGALRISSGDSVLAEIRDISASGIIQATNKARNDNGVTALLVENQKLNASARIKLEDMFSKQYFEHVSPNGIGIENLAAEVGYDYIIIGENLALGTFKTSAEIVKAWMNSPGHRANILNERYSEIGIAAGKGNFEGNTVWVAVQHFGLPLSACPEVDAALKVDIEANQAALGDLEQEITMLAEEIDQESRNRPKYREDVKKYNNLVVAYNSLLDTTKNKISEYNGEVAAFNACAAGN